MILVLKKYADESGRIKQDRILNAIKAFKSYLAQELTYKDLFAKCTWLDTYCAPRPLAAPPCLFHGTTGRPSMRF